jgi:O-antigen ligase
MAGLSIANHFDRLRLARIADGLAIAVAVSLPWSTSATSILLVLWLLALIPSLKWADVRSELATPAGGLPVLLFAFGALGMLWADVTLLERWKGLDSFFKLLVIPLLMVQFRRSSNGNRVFIGFLIACVVMLIASWLVTMWPEASWKTSRDPGVAVKNYIAQSAEFTICAAVLLWLAVEAGRARRWLHSTALLVLALAFLSDIFFIATSRTTIVVIVALVLFYGARQFRWTGFITAALAVVVLLGALWATSPYLRARVMGIFTEAEIYEANNIRTSTGERIVFWTKSVRFIESAPLFGHGPGSITEMFRGAAVGETGSRAEVSSNPHNQTFTVAIQLGLVGAAVLWAMWIFHVLVFRGAGLVEWVGLVVVVQNIVGALFNSFLFDFTEGWIYVVGVGVAAGMVRRQSLLDPAQQARVASSQCQKSV